MENSWYSPGAIWTPLTAVQVTVRAALVMVVPSVVMGFGSGASVTVTFQPVTGLTLTNANGVSWGSCTASLTVPALPDSLGTRKLSWLNDPAVGLSALTLTWASAVPAVKPATPRESAVTAASRQRAGVDRAGREEDMAGSFGCWVVAFLHDGATGTCRRRSRAGS